MKIFKKSLCLVLATLMLIMAMPISALATTANSEVLVPEAPPPASISSMANQILLDTPTTATVINPGEYASFYFTPEESGNYVFSSNGENDPKGYLFDLQGNQLAENDDGGNNNNFIIDYFLEAGVNYEFRAGFWSDYTGSYLVTLTKRLPRYVESVAFHDITLFEGENVTTSEICHPDYGCSTYYHYYYIPKYTVYYSDGTSEDYAAGYVEDDNGSYYIDTEDNQSEDGLWDIGTHTVNVTIEELEISDTFSVNIIESPVASITLSDVRVPEYLHGEYVADTYWDEELGQYVTTPEYFRYYEYQFCPNDVVITLKDGTKIYDGCLYYEGRECYPTASYPDQDYNNQLVLGNSYQCTYEIAGYNVDYTITIVTPTRNDYFDYYTDEQGAHITDFYLEEETLSVPATLGGKPVVGVEYLGWCGITKNLILPDSVEFITNHAIYSLYNLESITFGKNITDLFSYMFKACDDLKRVNVSENCQNYTVVDGVLYTKDMKNIIFCPPDKTGPYVMPDTVTGFDTAFENCDNLTQIKVSQNVSEVVYQAFYSCASLTKVEFPNGLLSIGDEAFYDDYALEDVNLPDTLEYIGGSAFFGTGIKHINIPDGIGYINTGTFSQCTELEKVVLPASITEIYEAAFYNCNSITDVYFAGSETDRNNMYIAEGNNKLLNATWHYNWTGCNHTYTNNADDTCNVCGEKTYTGGNTLVYEFGQWYHVVNRQKVNDTTLVNYYGDWYYVKNGVVDFSATTLFNYYGTWYYVNKGVVDFNATTLYYYYGTWYYVKNGVVDFNANTLGYFDGAWYYVRGGAVDFTATTLCNLDGDWYYVRNGVVDFGATTLVNYYGTWYYVNKGVVDFGATTICNYYGTWYYVNKGTVDFDAKTLCYYYGTWYYVNNGVVDFGANTLCNFNGAWYCVRNGVVDFGATTLQNYHGTWYYVRNGVVDFKVTTLCYYYGTWYYVSGGVVDLGANTLCNYNGAWYCVRNGVVDFGATTLQNYYGTWYYVRNGVVDFKATTLVNYYGTWYYVNKGTVNFKANLKFNYYGTNYNVVNGVVKF